MCVCVGVVGVRRWEGVGGKAGGCTCEKVCIPLPPPLFVGNMLCFGKSC